MKLLLLTKYFWHLWLIKLTCDNYDVCYRFINNDVLVENLYNFTNILFPSNNNIYNYY